ncbi:MULTISPECIES: NB-ARC domain-containing protein [unclassified Streptomyces]|uniref:ATP-binding protein n=1 Tax=unclassified Streptomyces TaxID=2593676 RepID=UPI00278C8CB0|nr:MULTISPECIES: NB-ARC domain-containing protein [unclassified Streptomyces]
MPEKRQPGNLPEETVRLVGRQAELDEVTRWCGRSRLVTVTGVGGVGKTRLAREAAAGLRPGFPDGVWWVDLSPLREGGVLAHVIAEALPLADQTSRPMLDVLTEYLTERRLLLVLDTCEHLVEECRAVAAVLLQAAPGLRVLATSRRPLGLHIEEVLALDPLPVPEADDDAADSLVLLTERAAEAVPGRTLTAAERVEAARLCRRLEGLPLALELAAARLRELPVAELNRRLDDRFAILGDTEHEDFDADPPWHQALRTAIGWSHQLCTPAERLAWARLSVFAGSFDADAARWVLTDERLPAGQVPELLAALVEKSILGWQPSGSGERYRMLDTIREYGAHWLRGLGEEHELRVRHRECCQALADRADAAWMGPEQLDWYERLVAEHANLRAALEFCLAEGDGPAALKLSGSLYFFWTACGFAKEGRHYLARALLLDRAVTPDPALGPAPGPHRAKALWAGGHVAVILGEAESGLRFAAGFREAVAAEGDEDAGFVTAAVAGLSLTLLGRLDEAAAALDAAPPGRPGTGKYIAAWFATRTIRGFVHVCQGEFAEAAALADELRHEGARRGETWGRAWGDYVLAVAALALGRTAEAAALARAALDGKRRFNNGVGIAMAVDVLACAAMHAGHAEAAARLLGVAEQTWHTLGTPQMGIPPLVAARRDCEARARRRLGDERYAAVFASGYDTDLDTGIAYALAPQDATSHI